MNTAYDSVFEVKSIFLNSDENRDIREVVRVTFNDFITENYHKYDEMRIERNDSVAFLCLGWKILFICPKGGICQTFYIGISNFKKRAISEDDIESIINNMFRTTYDYQI